MKEYIERIKANLAAYDAGADASIIDSAYDIACRYYKDRTTLDGRPVIGHFLEAALVLTDLGLDVDSLAAAIVRDAIMYGSQPEEISEKLGHSVREIAELLNQLGILRFSTDEEKQTVQLRQMFVAMARNVRVIMVELANHLVFMRYAENIPRKQREIYARNCLDIFSPLAHRLGVSGLKSELEDLCFKALQPEEYERLSLLAGISRKRREEAVERVIEQMKDIFRERELRVHITGRTKHLYSTYEKMMRQGKDFSELFDLAAVRVITDGVKECYHALAALHTIWRPVHEEFDDYIVSPKNNGYQSIHTVVIATNGQPVEVQIRTWEMHMTAEYGYAAHWRYKETVSGESETGDDLVSWIKGFAAEKRDAASTRETLQNVVIDTIEEKVFALTPKGRVIRLPAGSTPIDLAYRIHTEVGHRCRGAIVNGKIAPLDYRIRNGDVVEIITRNTERPSRDWMRIAVSPAAKSKIRSWFRDADRAENIEHGRSMLHRELDHHGLKRKDLLERIGFADLLKTYNYKTEEDLFAAIGCGDVSVEGAVSRIRIAYKELLSEEQEAPEPQKQKRPSSRRKKPQDIIAEGLSGVMVSFAKCCLPVPGDGITGFVTRLRGLSIHRDICPNIKSSLDSGERIVDVAWGDVSGNLYQSDIVVNVINSVGVLKDVLAIISEAGINVAGVKTRTLPNGTSLINLRLEVPGVEKIEYILTRTTGVEDVLSVTRKI